MELSAMIEALKRQVVNIDIKNEKLRNIINENDLEAQRIEGAIKELERAQDRYMANGMDLKVDVVQLGNTSGKNNNL